ncbi:RNA polymerase sigma factor [Natronincola ferrireducens]|uniref:RNA polymerase, sigma subunit, SigV n=1 Tax=Natronincola ferrireducens TaxID=393762 RepID=A0A1G9FWC9_9FIRM|nr:sigma-70 family RNA polymerase sigma factor [Natronincola ferrireducens]SDK92635.1 RNA polymerase, sigma subunit, SigV [Natronincola ferrireducens]
MKRYKKYSLVEDYLLENQASLYRLAYSYVRNKDDALDILQESLYKSLNSINTLHNPRDIKPWLYRIIINTALDFLRKNKKLSLVDEGVLELHCNPQEDTYKNFDLQEALDHLSPTYKTIIILRFFEDLTLEDIANILDENINTIKTRLYTALKKLRVEMEDSYYEG